VLTFGIYGLGFGIVVLLLAGVSGLTALGALVLLVAPALTAVAGRLLVELRGAVWNLIFWVSFALAIGAALAVMLSMALSGL
jgi:hypothetical protein